MKILSRTFFLLILILLIALATSSAPALCADILVFDFESEKGFDQQWMAPALTDYAIQTINAARPGTAMSRDRLRRLTSRWLSAPGKSLSFETIDAIRQHVRARIIIEGSFRKTRSGIAFSGSMINPDSGMVKDLSFTSKSASMSVLQDGLRKKLQSVKLAGTKSTPKQVMRTSIPDAYKLHWNGVYRYESGDLDKSREFFQKAQARDPAYIEPVIAIGRIMLESSNFSDALVQFKKALRISPGDSRARYLLGLTYSFLRQYNPAIDSFKKAISIDPSNPEFHYQLGLVQKELFSYGEALKELQKTVVLDSSWSDAWYQIAVINAYVKNESPALDALEKAITWGGPSLISRARNDSDFNWLHGSSRFQSILIRQLRQ